MPHTSQLESRLAQWKSDRSLLEPTNFHRRTAILDQLDRLLPLNPYDAGAVPYLLDHAREFSFRLESANIQLFDSIRRQIQTGFCPAEFVPIVRDLANPPTGLDYDDLDDLLAGVFQFRPPADDPRPLAPDSVFYQPTPARHIFHLISAAAITEADTLIDLGSGLGHVPLLASICTGATSIGIELDPAWVGIAKQSADALNLHTVTFLTQDAREADLSAGTVFYLYTPFIGSTLASVLAAIRDQAVLRSIRICTFGPCTAGVSNQAWLQPLTPPATDQITVFRPRT